MSCLFDLLQEDASYLINIHKNSILDGSKILITGASGLIGVNLLAFFNTEALKNKKIEIFITKPSNEGLAHLRLIFDTTHINIIDVDLTECARANGLTYKFDYIFHLATYGQPGRFIADDINTMRLNSLGLIKLFDMLTPSGRLFLCSTSEVYSGNDRVPHSELEIGCSNTTHTRACYIESKRFGEAYCYTQSKHGVFSYSGRISLCYGPGFRLSDKRVLNEFIINALTNNEIHMLDNGAARRVYCYVRDTIDIMLGIVHTNHSEPINIAGVEQVSILDLAKLVAGACSADLYPGKASNSLLGSPPVVCSSTSIVTSVLNKRDYLPIETGVKKSVEWAKALLKNSKNYN